MTADEKKTFDFSVEKQSLYRQESYTDLRTASIRRLTPVKPDGSVDKTRKTVFIGQASLMTPNGQIPIQSVIKAQDLQQAVKKYPEAIQAATDRLIEEAEKQKQKQEEPSRIIIPGR